MSKKAYEQIAEGLRDAAAFMRGEADRSKYRVHIAAAIDTRLIRKKLKLTQKEFAARSSAQRRDAPPRRALRGRNVTTH